MRSVVYRNESELSTSSILWVITKPANWKYGRVKYNTYLKGRIGWQGLRADEFIDEGPYLVTGMHFSNNSVNWDVCYHISESRYKEAPEIHLRPCDLIMTKDGTIGKVAYIDKLPSKATLNSHLLLIRPKTQLFINEYMKWLLLSDTFIQYYKFNKYGSTMDSISQEQFKNFNFYIPVDSYEQRRIAAFLDFKTAQFDSLIEKKERLIEKLEEAKKSLISEVVTGKVRIVDGKMVPRDPGELVDSGVEWLGMVPREWSIKRIKHIAILKSGNTITSESIEDEGEFPVYGGNGLRGYTKKYTHHGNFILIGRQGALCGNVNYASDRFWASEHALVVYLSSSIDIIWLGESLRSMNLNQYSVTAAQPGLSANVISNLYLAVPELRQQRKISEFLEKKSNDFSKLINRIASQIVKLKSAKKSLISEAVTGKIDLRDWEINDEAGGEEETA